MKNSSALKRAKLLKEHRNIELERLRLKILDAIRFSRRFWMTYRENTFGIASILNLIYKKSFFEVLFFTNKDVMEKGVPLLKIYTPIEDEIDFNELIVEPDFDDDGLVSPSKIIGRMRKLIRREFQKHLALLDNEANLIDERFENYIIDNNPYHREIRISYPYFVIELKVNFENYPLVPSLTFSKTLLKVLKERELNEEEIIKSWNEVNPPHIYQLIEKLCELVSRRLKIDQLNEDSQYLVINNLSIDESIKNVSFKIHKGKSIGIIFEDEHLKNVSHDYDILNLFQVISGSYSDFSGTVEIFGIPIQSLGKKEKKSIFILPQAYESKILNMKIKKAIHYGIDIKEIIKQKKSIINQILKQAGITPKLDEVMSDLFAKAVMRMIFKKRAFINSALEDTGLLNKKNKKFSRVTQLEFLLFSIGRALLQSPSIIMFLIPLIILDRLEYEKFNNYIEKIKKEFRVILLFHGPEGIVSNCDQILTIRKDESKIGTYNRLIEELPQSGEIITIELNNPDRNLIKKLFKFEEIAKIKEERKNEKYKLFLKSDPNKMVIRIIELFGQYLYSFKRHKASLGDYLEFFEGT
ncbi:MAG: hypothetical protein ACFFB0_07000 [Promethearchaeota archaeon]